MDWSVRVFLWGGLSLDQRMSCAFKDIVLISLQSTLHDTQFEWNYEHWKQSGIVSRIFSGEGGFCIHCFLKCDIFFLFSFKRFDSPQCLRANNPLAKFNKRHQSTKPLSQFLNNALVLASVTKCQSCSDEQCLSSDISPTDTEGVMLLIQFDNKGRGFSLVRFVYCRRARRLISVFDWQACFRKVNRPFLCPLVVVFKFRSKTTTWRTRTFQIYWANLTANYELHL